MQEFTVAVPDEVLADIATRVRNFQAPLDTLPADSWEYGTNLAFMRRLREYWLEQFDWRQAERGLNRFPQFTATVDSLEMHFIHEKGSGPSPEPLLLIHGWPGSTFEFQELIGPLAHPERFGMPGAKSFDVVVASLPGYGFSGKPDTPIGPRRTAELMNRLMTETLGYDRYFVQGGDWGAVVSGWLGFDHPRHCAAIHLNMIGVSPGGDAPGMLGSSAAPPETDEELAWAADTGGKFARDGGYIAIQSTKPRTLAYGLSDSPMGVAAWICEKFHAWSDLTGGDIEKVYGFDRLLTNIMIYLVTRSIETSTWMYYGAAQEGVTLPAGKRVEVPVALADVPYDFIRNAPRSYVDKAYNIARWTRMPRGGHFAALEIPELLLADIRAFFSADGITL